MFDTVVLLCYRALMTMRDYIRYVLWRLGRRSTVPAAFINNMPIQENNEIMVDIKQDDSLFFGKELKKRPVFLRIKAYQFLKQAQRLLPKGCHFKIYSAYRSMGEQRALWDEEYTLQKKLAPNLSDVALERLVRARYADPRRGFGGHQTGGAVDITLCDEKGKDFDMGTNYLEMTSSTLTNSHKVSREARRNRRVLYKALTSQGFQNYPAEWWHYSYGDRMWAAYQLKDKAIYGLIEREE